MWNLKILKKLLDNWNFKIKKIYLNTSNDLFSSDDWELKALSHFNWMDNYFTITFDNWDELSIWDFNKYQIDSDLNESTREKEQINELLNSDSFNYTINELNNFIEILAKENNLVFNK